MADAFVSRALKDRSFACMAATIGTASLVSLLITYPYLWEHRQSSPVLRSRPAPAAGHVNETWVAKSAKPKKPVVDAALTPPATTGIEESKPKVAAIGKAEIGRASWYKLASATASGETMDGDELTAAHPSLPIGTQVLVENLDNGRSVIVRINDRGPFTHNRIIDLSRAAAEKLDMVASGVATVRVSRIDTIAAGVSAPR